MADSDLFTPRQGVTLMSSGSLSPPQAVVMPVVDGKALVTDQAGLICLGTDGTNYRMLSTTTSGEQRVFTASRTDIARGLVTGASPLNGFGERSSIGTGATGEDIWRGAADIVPTPASAGEAMEVVSTHAQDGVAGTGVLTVLVDYLDATGAPMTTPVTMNGTTAVALTPTDVRFVQKMYTATVGSGGVAAGDISIREVATPANIYNFILTGGNMSLTPHRMVPLGKKLIITSWHATESQDKRVAFRLRATAEDGVLRDGVFLFKDAMYLSSGALVAPVLVTLPALSIVKITGWGYAVGGEASASWEGILFDV